MKKASAARARPRKTPRQERSREMLETIVEAAARVFVKEGYARATTNRIAAAAGISVGSLYQYFPGKDAIAVALLRRHRDRIVEAVASHLADVDEASIEVRVRELVRAALAAEGLHPGLHRVLIEQVLRTSARAEMVGFEDDLERVIVERLKSSPDDIGVKDIELAAFILVRTVMAITHAAVVDRPDHARDPRLVAEVTRMIFLYLTTRPPK
jgi:AcrR family transcriptional regulator